MKASQVTAILAQLMQLAISQQSVGWVSDGSMSKTAYGTLCGVSTCKGGLRLWINTGKSKVALIRWRMSEDDAQLLYEDIESFMVGAEYKTGQTIPLTMGDDNGRNLSPMNSVGYSEAIPRKGDKRAELTDF